MNSSQLRLAFVVLLGITLISCSASARLPQIDPQFALEEERRQRIAGLESLIRRSRHVDNIGYRILSGNIDLCQDRVTHRIGISFMTTDDFIQEDYREAARITLGVSDRVTITSVSSGSPADRAGLILRDRILRFNDKPIGVGKDAREIIGEMFEENEGKDVTLLVERTGKEGTEEHLIPVTPEPLCDYRILVDEGQDGVNALADGNNVILTRGMLRFVENDDELALVIGHELAHNSRGHIAAQTKNALLGRLIGATLGALAGGYGLGSAMADLGGGTAIAMFSQDFEAEADYVGVYYAARAGFDISRAADIWRRMGIENPAAIDLEGTTHPSTAIRFLAIGEAATEVQKKMENQQPLIPAEKDSEGIQ